MGDQRYSITAKVFIFSAGFIGHSATRLPPTYTSARQSGARNSRTRLPERSSIRIWLLNFNDSSGMAKIRSLKHPVWAFRNLFSFTLILSVFQCPFLFPNKTISPQRIHSCSRTTRIFFSKIKEKTSFHQAANNEKFLPDPM
jgi:hypothetical protein